MLCAHEPAMTDEQDTTDTSDTDPVQAPEDAIESEDDGDNDDEKDDDDDDDDDSKSKKHKKPKKVSIGYEAAMPRTEAVSYFESLVGGFRSGRIEFKQDGESLVLNPPDQLEIEVKATRKGDKAKIVFEIAWSDAHRSLEILN
jgi:amphi-Trp domain-containing protein